MYLLDTHIFLWAMEEPERLSSRELEIVEDDALPVYLSAVSLWEISIKQAARKLTLKRPLHELFADSPFPFISIGAKEAMAAGALPSHHTDPFDRMLVAQAQVHGCTLITRDAALGRYGVPLLAA